MMEEKLHFKQQRQEAFNWIYNLVSPKYIAMVEQRFDADSDMVPAFKAYIAYRIAVETAMMFNDSSEYHINTYQDIKKQLSNQVLSVIQVSRNPWLKKCFQEGLRFQPGSVELQLRQDIFLDMQKSFAFLRDQVLLPEMDQLKQSSKFNWTIQPWMMVAVIAAFMFLGLFINFGLASVLFNKDVLFGLGAILLAGLTARWTMNNVPGMIRSWQLYMHYGHGLSNRERRHLEHLHPDQLIGDVNTWFGFLNGANKSGVNETWVDLEQWMNMNLNLTAFKDQPSETQRQVTPGRPSSWGPMRFFRSGKMVDITPPKTKTPPKENQDIDYNQLGRYKPGS